MSGIACAVTLRVAGLRHEAVDHPMKGEPVIKALTDERLDLRDGGGCEIGPHLDDDASRRHVHVKRILQVCRHRRFSESERGDEQQETTQRCHDWFLSMMSAGP